MFSILSSRNDYVGNGAVHVYSFGFKIFAEANLVVTIQDTDGIETELDLTTDYTVDGVGESSGGEITLVDSGQSWLDADGDLLTDYRITIKRRLSLVQETDVRNQDDWRPEDIEDQFDKCVMIDQQQQEEIDRSVKLPETMSDDDFDPTLPTGIIEASAVDKVLGFNDDSNGFELKEISEVAALAGATEHAVTDGQSATDLTGQTLDSALYSSAIYDYEVIRGTTVLVTGRFSMHYRDSTWRLVMWSENYDDAGSPSGVTFSFTGTTIAQLQAALDVGAGNGTIKIKKHRFDA